MFLWNYNLCLFISFYYYFCYCCYCCHQCHRASYIDKELQVKMELVSSVLNDLAALSKLMENNDDLVDTDADETDDF